MSKLLVAHIASREAPGRKDYMTTVVIGIGRNLSEADHEYVTVRALDGTPLVRFRDKLTSQEWASFKLQVTRCAEHYLSAIYFTGAGLGEFEGTVEESWTLVGEYAGSIYGNSWGSFKGELDALRRTYQQDSIALTIGQTELIGAEPF
jgi:hypothetical protein